MNISDDYEVGYRQIDKKQKKDEGILYLLQVLPLPRRLVPPSLVFCLLQGSKAPGAPAACPLYKSASEEMQRLDVAGMYRGAKTLRPKAAWAGDGHSAPDMQGSVHAHTIEPI